MATATALPPDEPPGESKDDSSEEEEADEEAEAEAEDGEEEEERIAALREEGWIATVQLVYSRFEFSSKIMNQLRSFFLREQKEVAPAFSSLGVEYAVLLVCYLAVFTVFANRDQFNVRGPIPDSIHSSTKTANQRE